MHVRWGRLYKSTPAELALEDAVAALGIPYRHQFPGFLYGFRFFPDFVLPTLRVVLEVDDASHGKPDKIAQDAERTDYLQTEQSWKVARCTNAEAIADPRGAVRRMLESVGCWPLPGHLPHVADCLPAAKKCPPKIRREAKMAARLEKRKQLAKPRNSRRKEVN